MDYFHVTDVSTYVCKYPREAGLGSRSRVFLAPWSRSRLKKNRSRSRLEKKSGAGAGAAKKLADSSALLKDKNHKKIVL